jgi:hypothetical protein
MWRISCAVEACNRIATTECEGSDLYVQPLVADESQVVVVVLRFFISMPHTLQATKRQNVHRPVVHQVTGIIRWA